MAPSYDNFAIRHNIKISIFDSAESNQRLRDKFMFFNLFTGSVDFFCSLLIIDKEHLKMMHHVDITLHELEMFNLTSGRMGHENDNNDSGNVGGGGDGGDNGARDGSSHNLILNAPLTPCFQEDCYIRLRKETCKKFIHLFNSSRVVTKADQIALIYE